MNPSTVALPFMLAAASAWSSTAVAQPSDDSTGSTAPVSVGPTATATGTAPAPEPPALEQQPSAPVVSPAEPEAVQDTAVSPELSTSTTDASARNLPPAPARPVQAAQPAIDSPVSVQPTAAPGSVPPAPDASGPPPKPLNSIISVGFAGQGSFNTTPAFDYFSTEDLFKQGGFVAAVDLLTLGGAGTLAVDLEALFGETDDEGPLPNFIGAELFQANVGAGLSFRYAVLSWLAPHVRVGGGVDFTESSFDGPSFDAFESDSAGGYAKLGAGLTFLTPARRLSSTRSYFNSIGFSVVAEGGYQTASDLEFSIPAVAADDEGGRNIAVAATPLGTLSRSGAYVRLSALARF